MLHSSLDSLQGGYYYGVFLGCQCWKYVDVVVGIAQMDLVSCTGDTNGSFKFHSKVTFNIKQVQLYEAFCAYIFYPLSVRLFSGGEELRWATSVKQVLLHPYGNQDLYPTWSFFLSLTWWAHLWICLSPCTAAYSASSLSEGRSLIILL